jgi:hypothetical protein
MVIFLFLFSSIYVYMSVLKYLYIYPYIQLYNLEVASSVCQPVYPFGYLGDRHRSDQSTKP